MTDPRGFLRIARRVSPYRPVAERRADWAESATRPDESLAREQARRCMGCGVPFCHSGCPLGNLIPDWNDLVERGRWREAAAALHATNNFPEWTGALCPAPCEEACVLALNDDAVTIKQVELAIAERAFAEGWVVPEPAAAPTGRSVAVVGSGPAGLAAAQSLARAGHAVTVYERDDRAGGLLRYGIPDFKLAKASIDRRLEQLLAEGVRLELGADVGRELPADVLRDGFDAVVLATGAQRQRDLPLPGRALAGVALAMPYLRARNRAVAGLAVDPSAATAAGARVAIVGGGDTSADCLGCAHREGAAAVAEVAHGPTPPLVRTPLSTWPEWPPLLRSYGAHGEGGERVFAVEPIAFEGTAGRLTGLRGRCVEFPGPAVSGFRGAPVPTGEEVVLPVELALIAVGFAGVEADDPVYGGLGAGLDERGTVKVDDRYAAGADGVFAAGDCVRGADLIVTAIAGGRECARSVDGWLRGAPSRLPSRDRSRAAHTAAG